MEKSQAGVASGQDGPAGGSWPAAISALALGFATVIALYWEAAAAAVTVWTDSDIHRVSYFVIPIAAYFVWIRRHEIALLAPRPCVAGLLAVLFFGLIALVSEAASVRLGEQLAVVGTIQALILVTLGWRLFKALLFPILFLWLLVPAGDFMVPPLQRFTAALTVMGVEAAGLVVQADGNLIKVPSGAYSIVEECTALDFLIGALMISLVFGNLIYRGAMKRVAIVLAALIVAMLANGFRTTTVILITHFSEGGIDLAADHVLYGWTVFFAATVALLWGGFRFRDPVDGGHPVPRETGPFEPPTRPARVVATVVAAIIAAGAAPFYAAFAMGNGSVPDGVALCLPEKSGPWRAARLTADRGDWRPIFPGAGGGFHRAYGHDGEIVDLYVAYYPRQGQGSELIGWENRIADGKIWVWMAEGRAEIRFDGHAVRVAESRLGSRKRRRLVWHWYWVDGAYTANPVTAKLLQARAKLLNGDRRAALVAVSVAESETRRDARAVLQGFLDGLPALGSMLERAAPETGSCLAGRPSVTPPAPGR